MDRFWEKIDVRDPDECWEWRAGLYRDGYGHFHLPRSSAKRHIRAHRAAWVFTHGDISGDLLVCHSCDNPLCCNPSHLFLGTHADNNADCIEKGRWTKGPREPRPRKITKDDEAVIVYCYTELGVIQKAIGAAFGLGQTGVSAVLRRTDKCCP